VVPENYSGCWGLLGGKKRKEDAGHSQKLLKLIT